MPINMRTSKLGLLEIASSEALSNTKYLDSVNVHTIGIGMTRTEIPNITKLDWDKSLSIQECVDMFKRSLTKYENAVNRAVNVPISQHQFDALVSITYNIGNGGMAKSSFIRSINSGASKAVIAKDMMKWVRAGSSVLKGLVNRRTKEVALYNNGTYHSNGFIAHIKVHPITRKPTYGSTIDIRPYL